MYKRQVAALCSEHGLGRHLDGARLWNAHVASGVALADYGRLFDTVTVSFSKGLGALVGSMLVSSTERIALARVWRKRLGGGMRQAGILAAGAAYALDHHLARLADDHAAARALAEAVAERAPAALEITSVETNIVVLDTGERPAAAVAAEAQQQGIRVSALGPWMIRAVTHLDVTTAQCAAAGAVLGELLVS